MLPPPCSGVSPAPPPHPKGASSASGEPPSTSRVWRLERTKRLLGTMTPLGEREQLTTSKLSQSPGRRCDPGDHTKPPNAGRQLRDGRPAEPFRVLLGTSEDDPPRSERSGAASIVACFSPLFGLRRTAHGPGLHALCRGLDRHAGCSGWRGALSVSQPESPKQAFARPYQPHLPWPR